MARYIFDHKPINFCKECPFVDFTWAADWGDTRKGTCHLLKKSPEVYTSIKPEWCPLEEIREKEGI